MVTKTISIMEDAYLLMAMEKKPKESFSDLVRRKFGKKSIMEFAGALKDLSDEEVSRIKENIRAAKQSMDEGFKRKIKKLQAEPDDMP